MSFHFPSQGRMSLLAGSLRQKSFIGSGAWWYSLTVVIEERGVQSICSAPRLTIDSKRMEHKLCIWNRRSCLALVAGEINLHDGTSVVVLWSGCLPNTQCRPLFGWLYDNASFLPEAFPCDAMLYKSCKANASFSPEAFPCNAMLYKSYNHITYLLKLNVSCWLSDTGIEF